MADITLGRLAQPFDRSRAIEWVVAHRELVAVLSFMAFAAVLRLWDLGDMALHHDESLHATYSHYLFDGKGYRHDPLMHGPFLFHSSAAVFFLFGENDYTIRLLPALFGVALVGLPYLLRKQIGMKAVLIAALFLAISPTLLYYSRFDRNESWMTVWTFGMVICIWRYLDDQRNGWLYALAALMALSFASKEVTFITVAIALAFVDIMLAVELGRRREDERTTDLRVLARTLAMVPVAWVIAASWPLIGQRPFGRDKLPPIGDVLVVMGTLALPQYAAGIQILPFVGNDGYRSESEQTLTVVTVGMLLLGAAYVGAVLWKPKVWLIAAAFFFVPYILLYTTFFTNQPMPWTDSFWHANGGFWSGIWGSLDYWLDQHHVRRGDQPIYYYGLMTPLYEFLPMLLSLAGGFWLLRRGDSFRRWLIFWSVAIFVGLSVAGEKMPWLEAHIALPLAITGAVVLAAAIDKLNFDASRNWLVAGASACVTAVAVLLLVDADSIVLIVLGLALAAGVGGWLLGSALSRNRQALGRAALTVTIAVLVTLTVRASITASFKNNDTPVELMVYTQSSHDLIVLRDRIDAVAKESGMGYNLPVVVDGFSGFTWPWAWYLRDYHAVSYAVINASYVPPEGAVLLVHRSNASFVNGEAYDQTPYKHRSWFNETYRSLLPGQPIGEERGMLETVRTFAKNLWPVVNNVDSIERLGRFFLYRRDPVTNVGSEEGVAYFPNSLAAFDVRRAPAKPSPEPVTQDDGRIVFGRTGTGNGELQQPAGLFADTSGNIYVADSRNHRIQKFDAQGRFIDAFGRAGTAEGTFNEPWSVAADATGNIYVTDTWNHRIEKFSPDLTFIKAWGIPASKQRPDALDLFGPRSIALAPDGTLWVTDTGNKRVVHYSADGEPLGDYGIDVPEAERLNEPVGLAFDASGRLYIADAWNARIQRITPGQPGAASFTMSWNSREVVAKPYIAVLKDGRIVATDPGRGVLVLLSADGQPRGIWRPEGEAQPIGLVALPDGGFAYSDTRLNEVQIVPLRLIETLFR